MLDRSAGRSHPDTSLEIFINFRDMVSEMLHPDPDHSRPTALEAPKDHEGLEAHLEVTKLNISGITICSKVGSTRISSYVGGPNLPNIGDIMVLCKLPSESQQSVIFRGMRLVLAPFSKPSIPRLVDLIKPKNEETNVTHVENDFPRASYGEQSKCEETTQLSIDWGSVNDTVRKVCKAEKWHLVISPQSWTSSSDISEKISKLSRAWKSAAKRRS